MILALFGVVLWVVSAGALFVITAREQPVTEREREVILDIHSLAEWVKDFEPDSNYELLQKIRYIDWSYEVEYEYDESDNVDAPYLSCTLNLERKRSDVLTTYVAAWNAAVIGMQIAGNTDVTVDERNELFRWGDQSRFGILKSNEEPYGNMFVARNDKRVFFLVVSGVYFDDPDSIRELLMPVLDQVDNYTP